ncbi:MAG: ribonuclease III domain-containing protein [Vampirovibrionales bacterium]|nr:ribonuclease III domain-containing protein [Vampirovibrionales bacterium]
MTSQPSLPHPRVLALLGDAVYELWLREQAVERFPQASARSVHHWLIQHACGAFQAKLLVHLTPTLSEYELDWVRRGRNLPMTSARRNTRLTTQQSTGFEALLGVLHMQNPHRLAEIFGQIHAFLAPQ